MEFQNYMSARKKLLEDSIKQYLDNSENLIKDFYEAINYTVFLPGKRVRPIVMFATYEMLKGKNNVNFLKPLLPAAVSIELIHRASLVHDDLPYINDAIVRKGKAPCHKKFSESTAILVGDALLSKAFEVLTGINDKEIALTCIKILTESTSTRGIIGGQTVELLSYSKNKMKLNVLRYIHLKKTGAMLQAAVEMACAFLKVEPNIVNLLVRYAVNLGFAYQIIEDIIEEIENDEDYDEEEISNKKDKKVTYPSLIGIEKSRKAALKYLEDSYKIIKNMPNNKIMLEFIELIKERLP